MAALHHIGFINRHIIAQVVKTQLVIRAVGDVAGIGLAALGIRHVMQDRADRQTQEAIHLTHQIRADLGQIVVHRDDMHAFARQGV